MRRVVTITVMCAFAFMSASAFADMAQVKMTQGPGVGYGGAFTAEVMSGAISYDSVYIGPGSKFLTFCMEITETFKPGDIYYADSRDAAYVGGAGGSTGSPLRDYLDPVTAALYTQWLSTEDTTDVDTASMYQLAIWMVEDEIEWDHSQWEQYNTDTAIHGAYQETKFDYDTSIQSLITGVGNPTSIGNVRIMTLWTSYSNETFTGNRQDMLVAPVPAAVLLGILGLGVAGIKLRKFA